MLSTTVSLVRHRSLRISPVWGRQDKLVEQHEEKREPTEQLDEFRPDDGRLLACVASKSGEHK